MKYRVIDLSDQLHLHDGNPEFITFVYSNADPMRALCIDPFFYVNSEDELDEKMALLESDSATLEEAIRL